jgi:pimeloyl-ACP methyl ester carboxylesterase
LDPNDPVQAFIAAASDLLSPEQALIFPTYFQLLVAEEDPLALLPEFIAETFSGESADQMLALAETLTAEDFANSPYVAELKAEAAAAADPAAQLVSMRETNAEGMAQLLYSSIHCIDDILNESFEDAVNSYNSLAFPQLTNLDKSQVNADRCQNWLVDPAPIEVKDPVSSDVPALILQGAYDQPTPIYMGQTANSELENSTYVLIPQQRHGTWNNAGSCVGQIATAFLQDPEAELDLSCLEARRPQWALPDDGEFEVDIWEDLLVSFTNDTFACGAPGAVLLVDSPDGRFLEATGVSSVEEQAPMQVTDVFEIGSITKSFTVAVALQLQEEGVLSLDDPLSQWLPEMAAQVPNGEQITLRQLANHTTGIWDYGGPILEAGKSDTSLRQQTFTPEERLASRR